MGPPVCLMPFRIRSNQELSEEQRSRCTLKTRNGTQEDVRVL